MSGGDARGDGESEARTARLRREKWIEELAEALGRDAGAGIRDLHDDRALARGELELHRAAARRRLVGVHEEVDEERLQLTLVAEDEARDRSGRDPERQPFLLEGRLEELDRFAQRLAGVQAGLGPAGGGGAARGGAPGAAPAPRLPPGAPPRRAPGGPG